jgi:hypothetical protein
VAKDPIFYQTTAVLYRAEEYAFCVLLMFEVHLNYFLYTSKLSCPDLNAGNLKSLNDLAQQAKANYIIHTGDFGFYDEDSLQRIADKYVFLALITFHIWARD